MKIISAFPPANEQITIHVLNLIYYRHERFISFRLCNNNPPGISILKINYCVMQPENEIPDSLFLQSIKFDYSFRYFFR